MYRKTFYLLLSALFIVFSSCNNPQNTSEGRSAETVEAPANFTGKSAFKITSLDELEAFFQFSSAERYPLISAHRGGPEDDYPENALETFEKSAQVGAVIIECDVQMTADSVLYLMHDEKLERTTNGRGVGTQMTWKELKPLQLKALNGQVTGYGIPKLSDVLSWGKGKVIFTLDIKNGTSYEALISEIRKAGAESSVVLITYNDNQARKLHSLAPDLMLSVSLRNQADLDRLLSKGVSPEKMIAFVGTSLPDKQGIDALHEKGIWTILGTLGNLDRQAQAQGEHLYAEWVDGGIDILSTDRVVPAFNALEYYIRDRKLENPFILR